MISFIVPGRPVPAARMTRKSKFVNHQAQRYLAYKGQVGYIARSRCRKPIEGPVGVEIHAYVFGGRPGDSDNIAKAILDGCNNICWNDDRQVVELHVFRHSGRPQRAEIAVWEISG